MSLTDSHLLVSRIVRTFSEIQRTFSLRKRNSQKFVIYLIEHEL